MKVFGCRVWIGMASEGTAVDPRDESAENNPDDDRHEHTEHDYAHEPPAYYRDDSLWASYDRKVAGHKSTDESKVIDLQMELKRYGYLFAKPISQL